MFINIMFIKFSVISCALFLSAAILSTSGVASTFGPGKAVMGPWNCSGRMVDPDKNHFKLESDRCAFEIGTIIIVDSTLLSPQPFPKNGKVTLHIKRFVNDAGKITASHFSQRK